MIVCVRKEFLGNMTGGLIKSKDRVRNHAEVYTPEREVNAMLDLVANECENVESRFLEPACGTGNFLVKILERKLAVVIRKYTSQQVYFERYTFVAVSSIYGVDILFDNVVECRERLLQIVKTQYEALYTHKTQDAFIDSIAFVLSKNILWGDALSLKSVDGADTPITFAEWALVGGNMVKRRDYTLANLLAYQPMVEDNGQGVLFGADVGSPQPGLFTSDMGESVLIPRAVAEYPTTHYLEVSHVG